MILALHDDGVRIDDVSAAVNVQLLDAGGGPAGAPRAAVAVRPPGVADVSWVATIDAQTTGWWRVAVTLTRNGSVSTGSTQVLALDPGGTARLGMTAPTVPTPTLADVGGNIKAISTDPAPDRRLYETSTTETLAAGQPMVLVIDSNRFKTSPACGKAIVLARFMLDRWATVPIIHLEPFEYTLITDSPVIVGSLEHPVSSRRPMRGASARRRGARPRCRGCSSSTATERRGRSTRGSSAAPTWTSGSR